MSSSEHEFALNPRLAVFRDAGSEHDFRLSRAAAGRRNAIFLAVVFIAALVIFAVIAFTALGLGPAFAQILAIRSITLVISALLLAAALRAVSYRVLDRLTVLLAVALVVTSLAYTPFLDPSRVVLPVRTLLFVAFGYMLLPIALLPLTICLSALGLVLMFQTLFYFELSPPERMTFAVGAVVANLVGYTIARAMEVQRREAYANQVRLERANRELSAIGGSLSGQVEIREGQLADGARELRGQADQLRLLIDNLPVVIAYIDAEERYCLVNNACQQWHAGKDIVGRTMAEVAGPADRELRPAITAALRGDTAQSTFEARGPAGDERIFAASCVPHRGNGDDVLGVFVLMEDITERQRAEGRLQEAEKMAAMGKLSGGVAHDFNNLLTVILGNADMLAGDSERGKAQRQAIVKAAERGAELTQNMLAFSRIQLLSPQTTQVAELAAGMVAALRHRLGEGIEVATTSEPELWPATVDPGQLENALLNLALNARDAMPDGGALDISCRNVCLDDAGELEPAAGDYVVLAVADSGAGMDAETRAHAFEPFFTTKEVGEGSGLGLSMVHGFAKQSGGHAEITSAPGQGTTVQIYLPRAV